MEEQSMHDFKVSLRLTKVVGIARPVLKQLSKRSGHATFS